MQDEIMIEIDFEGKITVDVENGSGPSCQKVLQEFDEELGKPADTGFKPEYYQRNNAVVRENVRSNR